MSIIPSLHDDISLRILAFLPRSFYSRLSRVCRAWRAAFCCPNGAVFALRNRLKTKEPWIVFKLTIVGRVPLFWEVLLVDPVHRGCLKIIRPCPELAEMKGLSFDVQSMDWTKPAILGGDQDRNRFQYIECATVDGYVYYVGGESHGVMQKAARLEIASRTWEALPDLAERRFLASVVVLQGRICVVGGLPSGPPTTSVTSGEIWDANSRQWTLIHGLWPANIFGYGRPRVAVVQDRLYALRHTGSRMLEEVMYYENTSKAWISMGEFSFPEMVQSKYAFQVLTMRPYQMVGVGDMLLVFCSGKPTNITGIDPFVNYTVALYAKPSIAKPLTWGVWPLVHPMSSWSEAVIAHA